MNRRWPVAGAVAAAAASTVFLWGGIDYVGGYEKSMHDTCVHYSAAVDAWAEGDTARYYGELGDAIGVTTWVEEEAVGDPAHLRELDALRTGIGDYTGSAREALPAAAGSAAATGACDDYTGFLWWL